jgi:molybdate transport system permease protein
MSPEILDVIVRTVRIAALATGIVFVPAVLLGYVLARYDFPGMRVVSALTTLPLVLPPTAVGFLLLRMLADEGVLGRKTLGFDLDLLLTWKAAVLASSVMSAPLVVRTARVTFEGINPRIEAMARTLGYGRLTVFLEISLPMARRGLLAAVILGFTRALGEFGATVTVAGNIPGRTQTLSSAIFEAQQVGDAARGNLYMALAITIGFLAILAAEILAGSRALHGPER